ncbi:MAG: HAD-IA family hydrolase [Myxococcota bacterium]
MERVLLWDVMGTLVHDPFRVEMPAFFGISFEAMMRSKHPSAWIEFELGQRTEREFLDDFFVDGRAFDHPGFVASVVDAYAWLSGMESLLGELHAAGCAMHAFSNYPSWYGLIEDKLRLSRFLEWSFVSCQIGVRKPDPRAYGLVVDRLGISVDRLLFVDDREDNCRAAREAGIDAVCFSGATDLRPILIDAGLLST